MATVDLPAVREHLNIPTSTSDTELNSFLNAALSMVSAIVGPLSGSAIGRAVSDGTVMPLPTMPVQSVQSLVNVIDSATSLTVSDYTLDLASGLMYDVPAGTYTVTYTAGWSTGNLPDDLALGILELVRHLWTTQRGVARPGPGPSLDASTPVAYALPNRVLELLAAHTPVKVV